MYPFQIGEAIESRPIEELTSPYLVRSREEVALTRKELERANAEIRAARQRQEDLEDKLRKAERWKFLRFMFAKRIERLSDEAHQQQIKLISLTDEAEKLATSLSLDVGDFETDWWKRLHQSFSALSSCGKAWDVTSELVSRQYRSLATSAIQRTPISLHPKRMRLFDSKHDALHIANANGADLYIYPDLLVVFDRTDRFALIDLNDLRVEYTDTRFHEADTLPSDARVVGHTWRYTNNDGSPDRRFNNNYQIPVVLYGTIHLSTNTGLNEQYLFSDPSVARSFASILSELNSASCIPNSLDQHKPMPTPSNPSKYHDESELFLGIVKYASVIEQGGFWNGSSSISEDILDYLTSLFSIIAFIDGSVEDEEVDAFASIIGEGLSVSLDRNAVKGIIFSKVNAGADPTSFITNVPEFIKAAARFDKATGQKASETIAQAISVLGKAMITSDSDINESEVSVLSASLGIIKRYLDGVGVSIHVS